MNAPVKLRPDQVAEIPNPLARLREPFSPNQISKLPKESRAQADERKAKREAGVNCKVCGGWHHKNAVHLDYVGHAALTDRLLDVDPQWSWEPMALTADGLPVFDKNGGLWIKLTVCGVTRLGFGNAEGKSGGDAVKEIIGDALRNAAMRFGAALDLWHKGDLHADTDDEPGEPKTPAKAAASNVTKGAEAPKPPTLAERANRLEAALKAQTTADALRKAYGLASGLCADLDLKDPERLAEIEALYEARLIDLTEPAPKDDFGISDDEIPF